MTSTRIEFFRFHNGDKVALPFAAAEYEARLSGRAR
jgi:creatinase